MDPILLIVDDEPAGREALESLLLNQGYSLTFAANGVEALDKAARVPPDLILLDVMMPGMDGFEVCRRLRADLQLAEVPVVLVTALDDRDSRLQGIEAGADDFITKPIDRTELRARVQSITRLNRYRRLQEERGKLERQLERLNALRTIDLAITSSMDMQVTLDVLLSQVTNQLDVDAASVLIINLTTLTLNYAAGRGFRTRAIEESSLRLGEGCAGRVVLERKTISVPDLEMDPTACVQLNLLKAENFRAYHCTPILAKGKVVGVLEVFHRAPFTPDPDWLEFLETLGQQAAIAIDNAQLFNNLQRSNLDLMQAYDATIEGWSRALDFRDKETEGHTERVTEKTLEMARIVGMGAAELIHIRWGALLHDIGKLGVPDGILLKAGPLTDEEWVRMRQHPTFAYDLLYPIIYLRPALDIPYCHHEKWDGTGYPRALKGERIPLAARMFAIVDVWDALLSDRPYRRGWPEEEVRAYIQSETGKHFEPRLVDIFLNRST